MDNGTKIALADAEHERDKLLMELEAKYAMDKAVIKTNYLQVAFTMRLAQASSSQEADRLMSEFNKALQEVEKEYEAEMNALSVKFSIQTTATLVNLRKDLKS